MIRFAKSLCALIIISNLVSAQTNNPKNILVFSHQSGFYAGSFDLNMYINDSNLTIYYTTNGSIPTHADSVFKNPICISNVSQSENIFSEIPTSERWEAPRNTINKAAIIRAIAFNDTIAVTPVYSKTYFIEQENRYSFPIISIITDSLNLFQLDSGIYIIGNNRNFSKRGKAWERLAHLEYFDGNGESKLEQNIGIRIHGNKGRTFPQKSIRLYARSEYGKSKFNYRFFLNKPTTEFKRLILRSASSNDWKNTLFKNELAQELTSNLNLCHQANIPVIVFINGEYWGIHHLSERVDEHYLNEYYGVNKDSINLLSNNGIVEQGDATDFTELINYINTHSLVENTHYNYVAEQLDINNFIDYNISQIFLSNTDWPNNNVKFWKASKNGRWRWIMSDCDECMSYEGYHVLGDFLNELPYHQYFEEWSTFLMHNLLQNKLFKKQFRNRFENLLLNNFSTTNMLNKISLLKQAYKPELMEHINRWNTPSTMDDWEEAVNGLNSFAVLRPIEMKNQLNDVFKSPVIIFPNPANERIQCSLLIESENPIYLKLYNLLGECLVKCKYENATEFNNNVINVSDLTTGIYTVEIEINEYRYLSKIVVN